MTEHNPLPVSGYTSQAAEKVELVNANKVLEERVLRRLDDLAKRLDVDPRWLAVGKTHLELAFMAVNRAIFKPVRVDLPTDRL